MKGIEIRGRGLAAVAVGWQLWERGVPFRFVGEKERGASWAAAGLMNPASGRWGLCEQEALQAIEEAKGYYHVIAERVGRLHFKSCPVLRIFTNVQERLKYESRTGIDRSRVNEMPERLPKGCELGAIEVSGGGWLDVRGYLQDSWAFFEKEAKDFDEVKAVVTCQGYQDLARGIPDHYPARPAKGEILTVRVPGWGEERIITLMRAGWIIPIGGDAYRVGATYEWHQLDDVCSEEGRAEMKALLRTFTDLPFEVLDHVAAVRPIMCRSEPFFGLVRGKANEFYMNGLGSKGCVYAPAAAVQLVNEILTPRSEK